MSDDKVEKIRRQHNEAEVALRGPVEVRKVHPHDAPEWAMDAHDHRGYLLSEVERLSELYEKGVVALAMIKRMAGGAIYSQESIHSTAATALKEIREGGR